MQVRSEISGLHCCSWDLHFSVVLCNIGSYLLKMNTLTCF